MALRIERIRGDHAHKMRREPTEPEKRLWRYLSNSQLGGFKFRRQTAIGTFICDFSCSAVGLIVEIDGDTHDPDADRMRDQRLMELGYSVMRFTNDDVMRNVEGILEAILSKAMSLPQRRYKPTPTPPLEGRGF